MEVHTHTHTERKKWTHYFWEFLMLFLAVFCGFLAENQREHMVEHKRANQLAASLLNDLQKDTAQLNMLRVRREKRKLELDSFYLLLETAPENIDRRAFYRFVTRSLSYLIFSQSTGTINQLKNAGYLRYFSDNKLLNYISDYEFWIQDFKGDEDLETKWINEKLSEFVVFNLDNGIINKIFVDKIYPDGAGINFFNPEGMHQLKAIINELRTDNHVMQMVQIPQLINKADELIKYLHEKYHLK
jgi:hypothetical protein